MWIFYSSVPTRIEVTVASNVTTGGTDGNTTWWNSCTNPPVITAEGVPVVRCSLDPVKHVLKLRILVHLSLLSLYIVIFVLKICLHEYNYNHIANLNKTLMPFIWIHRVNVSWLKMKYILFLPNIVKVLSTKLYKAQKFGAQ